MVIFDIDILLKLARIWNIAAGKKKVMALYLEETVCYLYKQSQSWENQIQPDLANESYLRIIGVASGDRLSIEC